jgi:probable F420-dependent oxidoreductase
MKLGLVTFPTEYSMRPDELGRVAEDLGFESLFFTEHTHIPAERTTPYPWGGEIGEEYYHTLDPFLALMSAAQATSTLMLGTGICLVAQRDPILLAKEVATLDVLSGDRVILGVGAGWNLEEMRNHGTDPGTRFKLMQERVEAMRTIWSEDEASYSGDYVSFDRIWQWPKPLQRPGPPVLVAGDGPHVLDRVLAFGDGWFPVTPDPAYLSRRIGDLNNLATASDPPRKLPVTVYHFGGAVTPRLIEKYADAGVDRVLVDLPAAGPREVVPIVRQLSGLASN